MSKRRVMSSLSLCILAAMLVTLGACTRPGGGPSVEPPVPLSNVTPAMLNADGTFRKNGLVPVDPMEQF